jgi:predicted restriction endonuclease
MLEEQQLIGNMVSLALSHQVLLEREAFGIGDDAEPPDLEGDSHVLR